jgi:hypothetical protein
MCVCVCVCVYRERPCITVMFLPSNCPTCARVEDELALFGPVARRSRARSGPMERTSSDADRERYVVLCACVCVCVCVFVCVCVCVCVCVASDT